MKKKFVKMTAAVLAGMMLLTGCGQSADSTGAANDSAAQGTENTTADAAADSTASGDKVKIEYWHCNAETQGGLTVDELVKQFNEQKHNDWIKRMQEVRNRKMELIQSQQRQLKWMKNELPTLLSQTAADEMAEDIKDKEEFIQELEADLAEINEKLGVGSKK